jgi:uncharacterized membrane protein YhaH (DUF805 family)
MNFGEAIQSGFRNYVGFSGRAPRSEFWYWTLFSLIGGVVTLAADATIFSIEDYSVFSTLFNLVVFLPSLAMGVRRLHDIDRTGWWFLIVVTGIGAILLIVWDCFKGTSGPNRFGPDPL